MSVNWFPIQHRLFPTSKSFILGKQKRRFYHFETLECRSSKPPNEVEHVLPGVGAAEEEHHNSLSIFLVLVLLGLCILLIHIMLKFHFHYVPESVAVILIGKI